MIPVQNIYHMLSYAFQVLNEQGYKDIATEQFDNVAELCAAILSKGIAVQLKRGLGKEYIPQTEALSSLRGKIDITESIKTQSLFRKQLICTYDDFTVNSYLNRILKSTMELLLHADISKARKKALRKLMIYFTDVDVLDVHTINWNIRYDRNNQTYRMLISICYLVVKGLLQTNTDGSTRLMDFIDEQRMCRLYEKFILEYYRKEHPDISAWASQVPWQLDDGFSDMLPVMQSDITLSKGNRTLIIDAKYYAHNTQTQYDVHTLHSGNLYQIFTYVKNKDAEYGDAPHEVSGMLLYENNEKRKFDCKLLMAEGGLFSHLRNYGSVFVNAKVESNAVCWSLGKGYDNITLDADTCYIRSIPDGIPELTREEMLEAKMASLSMGVELDEEEAVAGFAVSRRILGLSRRGR